MKLTDEYPHPRLSLINYMGKMITKYHRLPKSELIRKENEYQSVFLSGKVILNPYFSLFYANSNCRKFGVYIAKNTFDKAVVRNRIKRYLKEIYRTNKEYFSEKYAYVIRPRPNIINIDFHQLKNEILSLVRNIV